MRDDVFAVRLAGRHWELPHLPFRAIKAIQPALFRIYDAAGGAHMSVGSIAMLGEDDIERLAYATWRAISEVDPGLTFEEFMDLRFSVHDLLISFPSVAQAIGLRPGDSRATSEASPESGKSISTR